MVPFLIWSTPDTDIPGSAVSVRKVKTNVTYVASPCSPCLPVKLLLCLLPTVSLFVEVKQRTKLLTIAAVPMLEEKFVLTILIVKMMQR